MQITEATLLAEYERTKQAELETRRAEIGAREERARTRFWAWTVTLVIGGVTALLLTAVPLQCSAADEARQREAVELRLVQCQQQIRTVRDAVGNAVVSAAVNAHPVEETIVELPKDESP
jgi:hypothetical protein